LPFGRRREQLDRAFEKLALPLRDLVRWPHGVGQETGRGKWNAARVSMLCSPRLGRHAEVDPIRGPAV
jgi:hypothetical protein